MLLPFHLLGSNRDRIGDLYPDRDRIGDLHPNRDQIKDLHPDRDQIGDLHPDRDQIGDLHPDRDRIISHNLKVLSGRDWDVRNINDQTYLKKLKVKLYKRFVFSFLCETACNNNMFDFTYISLYDLQCSIIITYEYMCPSSQDQKKCRSCYQ